MSKHIKAPVYDREYEPGEYPSLPAPVNTQGISGWLRENLFNNWTNGIVTCLIVLWLAHLIPPVINWGFVSATTVGQSSQQCLIAQRISTFNEAEVAEHVSGGVLKTPTPEQIPGADKSLWTKKSLGAGLQRTVLSTLLFQSPSLDSVISPEAMEYKNVDRYLTRQSQLLSTIDRTIEEVNKSQASEYAFAAKLFDKPLEIIQTPADQLLSDAAAMEKLFKGLDEQLKVIDIRRVYKNNTQGVDYEGVREFQPYKFKDARYADKYAGAQAYLKTHYASIQEAMVKAQAATLQRADDYLPATSKEQLALVDIKAVQAEWDAAQEAKNPAGIAAALHKLEPVMGWAESHNGACWTYPKQRGWKAFTFGAYPEFLKWRPIAAFILMMLALVPILAPPFRGRDKLWFVTAIFPFAAYALMTGDTIIERFVQGGVDGQVDLSMRFLLALFLIGFAMLPMLSTKTLSKVFWSIWWAIVGVLGLWLITGDALSKPIISSLISNPESFDPLQNASDFKLWGGLMLNILLGVVGILLSLPIGVALALGRRSTLPVVSYLCTLFIEVIRGVPLITILFMGALVFPYFVPTSWDIAALPRMIIAVTLFSSAYMAEVIRGGLQGLNKGQYEGAAALGLGYWKAHRLIILPQALKIVIPGIVNTFIGLFKDTTLVSIVAVGLFEILGTHNNHIKGNADWRGVDIEGYVFVALFFFICCFAMARYSIWLEKRLDTGHRS